MSIHVTGKKWTHSNSASVVLGIQHVLAQSLEEDVMTLDNWLCQSEKFQKIIKITFENFFGQKLENSNSRFIRAHFIQTIP